jgi:ribosomal-protein-alanine N-acetyltransferase
VIDTARLRLEPYAPQFLLALIESADRFAEVSGLRAAEGLREFLVSGEVAAAYLESLRAASTADPWLHGFAAIHRESGLVVGNGGFKGAPDPEGAVEIAYGIVPAFRSQGYATEVASGLIAFACDDSRVRLLRAHTLPESNASTRVLMKCGFAHRGEVIDPDDGPVWRWERTASFPKRT